MMSASEEISANIRRLREQRKMTWVELSERMGVLGHPILPLGLRRIVAGERRVDVDELVALGAVFSVEPWSLTNPPSCAQCKGKPPEGFSCMSCGKPGWADER